MNVREITSMGFLDADELRKRGLAGDAQAVKDYVLYSVWKGINADKAIPRRAKIKTFSELAKKTEMNIEWQTASN